MEQRTYRGDIEPEGLADALVVRFNHGDLMAQKVGREGHLLVQIATREWGWGPARTALTVGIAKVEDGVNITLGQQRWLDAAADLVQTGLGALLNPLSLIGRIDDARLGLAERHLTVTCPYCGVGNPVGAGRCSVCGAGLGDVQPIACPKCGHVAAADARFCSRCGTRLMKG